MDASRIPIIGAATVTMVCPQGHRDVLAMPFCMILPSPIAGQADAVRMCRLCFLEFLAQFPVEFEAQAPPEWKKHSKSIITPDEVS